MELDVVACNTALTLCDAQWQRALEILHQTQALSQGGMKKVKQRTIFRKYKIKIKYVSKDIQNLLPESEGTYCISSILFLVFILPELPGAGHCHLGHLQCCNQLLRESAQGWEFSTASEGLQMPSNIK